MLVLFKLLSSAVIIKALAFLPFKPIKFYYFAVFSIKNTTVVTKIPEEETKLLLLDTRFLFS